MKLPYVLLALPASVIFLAFWQLVTPPKPEAARSTWCPTPEQRASVALPIAIDGDTDIPARGADVTTIYAAASMPTAELARHVNRLIAEVNPAVAVKSACLSWPGDGDAVLVVLWERK